MPATPESIIAFDFGLRRIGVAVGQAVTQTASPVGVVRRGEIGPDWDKIAGIIDDWRPSRLVVGRPSRKDGTESDIDAELGAFIAGLARFGLEVAVVDERHTSVEAMERLKAARSAGRRRRVSKEAIDAGAAVLIAERWLHTQK